MVAAGGRELVARSLSSTPTASDIEQLQEISELLRGDIDSAGALSDVADVSRSVAWRDALRQSGILSEILETIRSASFKPLPVVYDSIRVVANCCADNDTNRAEAISCLGDLVSLVAGKDLPEARHVAIIAIFNICNDWDPGIERASRSALLSALPKYIHEYAQDVSKLRYAANLLEIVVQGMKEKELLRDHAMSLLDLPSQVQDVESYLTLSYACLVILETTEFHQLLSEASSLPSVLSLLENTVQRTNDLQQGLQELGTVKPGQAEQSDLAASRAEQKENSKSHIADMESVAGRIILGLAQVSAIDSDSTQPTSTIDWLTTWLLGRSDRLCTCACLILGNLGRSDETAEFILQHLQGEQVFTSLDSCFMRTMRGTGDAATNHAAISLLLNLSLSKRNKAVLGKLGIIEAACGIAVQDHSVPVNKLSALRLVRLLITGSLDNLEVLVESGNMMETPLRQSEGQSQPYNRSPLSCICATHEFGESGEMRGEIGRLLVSALRVLQTVKSRPERIRFDAEPLYEGQVLQRLKEMVSLEMVDVVRADGWFGLALFAQNCSGAKLCCKSLDEHFVALVESTVKTETESEKEEPSFRNFPNILLFIGELCRQETGEISDPLFLRLERLLVENVDKLPQSTNQWT